MKHLVAISRRTLTSVFILACSTVVVAGCASNSSDQPPPEHVVGKYTYRDSGSIAKHPWTFNAALVLERDAQYTLEMNVDVDDDPQQHTSYGTFRVEGDRLLLDPADGADHDFFEEYTIDGDRLTPKLGLGARLAVRGLKLNPVFVKAD